MEREKGEEDGGWGRGNEDEQSVEMRLFKQGGWGR